MGRLVDGLPVERPLKPPLPRLAILTPVLLLDSEVRAYGSQLRNEQKSGVWRGYPFATRLDVLRVVRM